MSPALLLAFALSQDMTCRVDDGGTTEFFDGSGEIDVAGHTLDVTMPADSWRGVTFRGTKIGNSSAKEGRLVFGSRNTKYYIQTKKFTGGAGNILDVRGGAWVFIQDEIEREGCWTLRTSARRSAAVNPM